MSEPITSLQNPRIKAAARLRDARDRKETGLILIDGVRELARADEAGVAITELFVCGDRSGENGKRLVRELSGRGAAVYDCAPPAFAKLVYGERDEGVIAVARRPVKSLCDLTSLLSSPGVLIAVVERVEKPGNLGAILRTADAAGLDAVIAADAATDIYGPNAIRASLGAVFTIPLVEAGAAETIAFLQQRGIAIVAATPDAPTPYTEADMTGPTAVVLGSEAAGLSSAWNGEGITRARLPMHGRVNSLNVSATAAVLFYEARRQRAARDRSVGEGTPGNSNE